MGMDWSRAADAAAEIAAGWAAEGGPGGAAVLCDARGIRAEAAGGFANLEHEVPFTPGSLNRWASITKHIFCATLLRDGRISLNDRLGAHLPGLAPALGEVSVEDALGMTGGVPDLMETAWLCGIPPTAGIRLAALRDFALRLTATNFPAGAEVSYTNTGYLLAEAALEAKGESFAEALGRHFTEPLDLAMHYPADYGVVLPGLAHGYWKGDGVWRRGVYGVPFSASGAIAGSARTLADWIAALLRDTGPTEGVLDWLAAPRRLPGGAAADYGRGLAVHQVGGVRAFGHGGSLPGYKDHFLIHRETGAGVVVVSNREDTDAYLLALRVLLAGLGQPFPEAAPDALPSGLFVADSGPTWIEIEPGLVTFMGAQQKLFRAPGGGAMTLSPYMAIELRAEGDGIAGHVGHVPRRFRPVAAGLSANPAWAGRWSAPALPAAFEVRAAGGTAMFTQGEGTLRAEHALTPLDASRAIFRRSDAQWTHRPCLDFAADSVRVATNRSRGLVFGRT